LWLDDHNCCAAVIVAVSASFNAKDNIRLGQIRRSWKMALGGSRGVFP